MLRFLKPLTVLVLAVVVYLSFLPSYWPPPRLALAMPMEAAHDQDLPFDVQVRTWHANYRLIKVHYYPAPGKSTAKGPQGVPPAFLLQRDETVHDWPVLGVNWLTWPHRDSMRLTFPLAELARRGLVGKGMVRGKLDITLDLLEPTNERRSPKGGFVGTAHTVALPFSLKLL